MIGPMKWRSCCDGASVGLVEEGDKKSSLYFGQAIQLMMLHGHLPQLSTTRKNFVK